MRFGAQPGASLLEAVITMTLSSFVMAVMIAICIAQMKLMRVTAEEAASAEAVRVVTSVLSGEARRMTPTDVRATSSDSLAIRAFRGTGLPCGATAVGVLVRYSGDRLPDPAKDSILVTALEQETSLALLDSTPAAGMCPAMPGESVLLWRTGAALPQHSVLLVFESGTYHLSTRALRYRVGAGGRQPLTAEALRHPHTRFTGVTADAITFQVQAGERRSGHAAPFGRSTIP